MNDLLALTLLIFGVVMGVFYFGGLWLTLRHLTGSQRPWLMALGSFLARSMVCVFGFYLIVSNGWDGLVFSLVGFIMAKLATIHCLSRISRGSELKWWK